MVYAAISDITVSWYPMILLLQQFICYEVAPNKEMFVHIMSCFTLFTGDDHEMIRDLFLIIYVQYIMYKYTLLCLLFLIRDFVYTR